ncbi:MAG: hypothetical protein VX974_17485 [Pseudomonadota bacterium]|nr:hypothetical protein [Pseudomonadota bacterium]
MRRGTIFYFRKRLPKASPLPGKRISQKSLFCASLQTNVLAEAFARAAQLLDFYETKRKQLLLDTTQTMSDAAVNVVLHDMLRTELNRIIRGQDAPTTNIAAVDAQIAELQAKAERLRQNARMNDFSDVVREIQPFARQP